MAKEFQSHFSDASLIQKYSFYLSTCFTYAYSLNDACLKIGKRAGNLFHTHQLWCSGAALIAFNQSLGGGLTEELAIRLTSGISDGMGGSGCLCGALNGWALPLRIFLDTGRRSMIARGDP